MSKRHAEVQRALEEFDVEVALRLVRGHARRGVVSDHTLEAYRTGLLQFFRTCKSSD